MLINLSNHPNSDWDSKQSQEALNSFGNIIDLDFPQINPAWDNPTIVEKAKEYFIKITAIVDECANEPKTNAVHIQGEFTFVCQLVIMLKSSGIKCVASTSTRNVEVLENGEKIVKFTFVQFREY